MTPNARVAAAIEILDGILAGAPAEQHLTRWARGHRFAGSGDRAAIRDHVFDALRRRRSAAALGGAETGRGLMLGLIRAAGDVNPDTVFDGKGYGPAVLTEEERVLPPPPEGTAALDCPAALEPMLRDSLGNDFAAVMRLMQSRAPVFLRVNVHLTMRDDAVEALAADGIEARPYTLSDTALEVIGNTRKIRSCQSFLTGLVEVQDAASQAVADLVPVSPATRVLDFCAGGGGKTLALAARGAVVTAHDANPDRMRDLPERARRAKLEGRISTTQNPNEKFDVVFADVPCSGTGAWRRNPDTKWRLSVEDVAQYAATQREILWRAAPLTGDGGILVYVTCSLLEAENSRQINAFLEEKPNWQCDFSRMFSPLEGGDGFFIALLRRKSV